MVELELSVYHVYIAQLYPQHGGSNIEHRQYLAMMSSSPYLYSYSLSLEQIY